MKIYKIRNKLTGLFSDGGSYPSWKKNGKAYRSLAAITNWLNSNSYSGTRKMFKDCEIVEFTMLQTNVINLDL
jgi:hypothetical protein